MTGNPWQTRHLDRRAFLRTSATALGGAVVAAGLPIPALATATPLGLQLITVMTPLEKDFEGTFKTIANIGYTQVETLGSMGQTPEMLRETLDKYGLTSPSQHVVPGDLYKVYEAWNSGRMPMDKVMTRLRQGYDFKNIRPMIEEGIARAKITGQKYLIWSALFDEQVASRQAVDGLIKIFNQAGELCAAEGLTFGFHNGSKGFKPVGGDIPYDLILKNTDPDKVKMELDSYYATAVGINPLRYFADYPGRYKLCHLKDIDRKGDIVDLGRGRIDFPALIAAARKAGVDYYYIEHDRPKAPLETIKSAYAYMRRLEKQHP